MTDEELGISISQVEQQPEEREEDDENAFETERLVEYFSSMPEYGFWI